MVTTSRTAAAEYERLMNALLVFYTEEEARRWLDSPRPLLDGETASYCIETGQLNRVWQVIDALESSAYL